MSRMRILLLGLAAVLVLGACTAQEPEITAEDQVRAEDRPAEDAGAEGAEGTEGEEEAPAADVAGTFVAIDIDFPDYPTEIVQGDTVELRNDGGIFHNVVIDDTGEEVLAADGGQSDTWTVDLEPGTYPFHCDVPGHEAAGMVGEFTVVE